MGAGTPPTGDIVGSAQRRGTDRHPSIVTSAASVPLLRAEVPIHLTVRRAQQGDPRAFGELYDAHAGRVHALCLRMSGDPAHAEELLQDVWVRAWRRLATFRGESSFATWLHRLAVNEILQQARSDRRRRARVVPETEHASPPPLVASRSSDPAITMDLECALAALPDVLRQVFVLHDVEGYQHHEIAEWLDCPVGTSRSHLFRARRLLREYLR